MDKRRVVVNILTFNRVSELTICLSSLLSQTFQEWDLVIVDDHSNHPCTNYKFFNDVVAAIKTQGHAVRIIRHKFPWLNIGKSRNHAVKLSKEFPHNTAEFIVRIDDDSWIAPDYIEKLYNCISKLDDVAAVGGVVPLLQGPNYYRKPIKIFNETKWDKEGNIIEMGDDGGIDYKCNENSPLNTVISHHLRSSLIFRTSVHDKEPHPLEYGNTGYREETDLTIRWRFAGWKLLTDISAKCYHQKAGSGGARIPSQHYQDNAMQNDMHFKEKMKYLFELNGGAPKV